MTSFRVKASLGVLLAVSLLVAPVVARAQGTRTFGTPSVSHTLQAFAFTGDAADSAVFDSNSSRSRFCSGSGCVFHAAVFLPAGVSVTSIELEACDTNPAGAVTVNFNQRVLLEGASPPDLATVSTGFAATPGCALFTQALATPHTIDNVNNTYIMRVPVTGGDNTTRFQAVRIFYNLQLSPAPAVATFDDVPTSHPFFLFIEALVAAGITNGCSASPPLYCPEHPLTREQAAAFFGRALGLQFAP
jgi:hypothetical protein